LDTGRCYYVDSNEGNDANSGESVSSPWKTLAKVNAMSFSAGDQIYLKAGSEFAEQLTITSSGSPGNPIIFGAYGSGAMPVITGAVGGNTGISASGVHDITINGLEITKTGLVGIGIGGPSPNNWTITHCNISQMTTGAIVVSPATGTVASGLVISYNQIGLLTGAIGAPDYNRGGILVRNSSNALITHNHVATGVVMGIQVRQYDNGTSTNPTISYNELTNNEGNITCVDSQGCNVLHNWIHDSLGEGVQTAGNTDVLIAYNLLQNIAISTGNQLYNGFDDNEQPNGKLYHNTCEHVTYSCVTLEGLTGSPGWDVRNNIFDTRLPSPPVPGDATSAGETCILFDYTNPMSAVFSNNLCAASSPNASVGNVMNVKGYSFSHTVPQWEAIVNDSNSIYNVDPKFTDVSTGDLSLEAGSPAIGAGVVIKGINQYNLDLGALPHGMKSVFDF
jgi:hypothetical protein